MHLNRRRFLAQASVLGAADVIGPLLVTPQPAVAQTSQAAGLQRVAAIQFTPKLGDIPANLQVVDKLVREALAKGARWVVLPEFFSSGTAMHRAMFEAARPLDGPPMQMLKELAKVGNAYIGGSFLAKSAGDVYNTFVLACPDGSVFTHDKDFPTMVFESAFFTGGEDEIYAQKLKEERASTTSEVVPSRKESSRDGAFSHAGQGIGTALCWEIVRNRTAKRLLGKIDILLASSGWWTADPDGSWPGLARPQAKTAWAEHQSLIDAAPQRFARMLGTPVVHANFTGPNPGFSSLAFDAPADGRYLGSSQIVDAQGRVVARMQSEQGVLVAEVHIGRKQAAEPISDAFWLPEVSDPMRRRWAATGAAGRDYYATETRARYRTS